LRAKLRRKLRTLPICLRAACGMGLEVWCRSIATAAIA
jgi:hypothetical protein